MTRSRRGPLLVGTLLFCLGLGTLVVGGLATLLSVDWLVRLVGHDYLLVAGVGGLALLVGLGVLLRRSVEGFEQATPPSTESVPTGTPLGAEIDRVIDSGLDSLDHITGTPRATIRSRLRRAAIETVSRTEGCSSAAATAAVGAGEWTDDRTVATFLAEDGPGRLRDRVRDALPGRSRFQSRTRRTVRVLCGRDGVVSES